MLPIYKAIAVNQQAIHSGSTKLTEVKNNPDLFIQLLQDLIK